MDKLALEIEKFKLGYSGLAVLINNEELILACSNPGLVGQQVYTALGDKAERKETSRLTDELLGTMGNYCLAVNALPNSVQPGDKSWQVMVAQSRAEILESSSSPATWSLLTVIIIIPIVLILGMLFTNSVRRSLDFLITATRMLMDQRIYRSYVLQLICR